MFQRTGGYGLKQIETFSNARIAGVNRYAALNTPVGVIDISWLEAAAAFHDVSPDPNDYVFSIQRAVVADIPNRNSDAFTKAELHRYNPNLSLPVWATFNRRPIYFEHNQVPKDARGMLFKSFVDVEGPYQLVTTLSGISKRKDADLAAAVKNNTRPYWSMGCVADTVTCSFCKKKAADTREFCTHIAKQLGSLIGNQLVYEILGGVTYIELSNVSDPAALIAGNGILNIVNGIAI
jgi:hypothetical protein